MTDKRNFEDELAQIDNAMYTLVAKLSMSVCGGPHGDEVYDLMEFDRSDPELLMAQVSQRLEQMQEDPNKGLEFLAVLFRFGGDEGSKIAGALCGLWAARDRTAEDRQEAFLDSLTPMPPAPMIPTTDGVGTLQPFNPLERLTPMTPEEIEEACQDVNTQRVSLTRTEQGKDVPLEPHEQAAMDSLPDYD